MNSDITPMILMPPAAVHVNSAQTQAAENPDLFLEVARSGIGYEIFNEAVDSWYMRSKTLGENEMELVLNLARMNKVKGCGLNRRQVIWVYPHDVKENHILSDVFKFENIIKKIPCFCRADDGCIESIYADKINHFYLLSLNLYITY